VNGGKVFESRTFARDRRTWIATLAAVAVLWAGTSAWLNRRVGLAPRRLAQEAADGRFVALAFDRIVPSPDGKNLDRARLREALRALAAAGWQAVTLEDVRAAYQGTRGLPEKPILVSFDEGYLGTYEGADPVLRELRWPAVMFLRTERQEMRDSSFLFWDRLRRMVESGLWEIGSGDPAAPQPRTPAEAVPSEPPGAALIAARLAGPAVVAWAPRGAEPLVALSCASAGARLWRSGGPIPWLGFFDDVVGANATDASPFRIGRLRVDPRWTAEELLRRIDVAVANPGDGVAGTWVAGEGATPVGTGAVRLVGRPRAEIWIPSARWVDDWSLDVRIRLASGEFWIVQPGQVSGREWRFGGTDAALFVEDRSQGRPPDVLARATPGGAAGAPHRVRIVKRGSGVSVRWDGAALTAGPVALPERWRGKVGLVAYRSDGEASVEVEGLEFASFPYTVRAVASSPGASEVAALVRDSEAIAALAPPWATIEGDRVEEAPFDRDLFRILARRYAWDILPTVGVVDDAPARGAAADWLRALPERVGREGWSGVRLDLSAASPEVTGWEAASRELDARLRAAGKRLVVAAR
jgi:hypothetical protein